MHEFSIIEISSLPSSKINLAYLFRSREEIIRSIWKKYFNLKNRFFLGRRFIYLSLCARTKRAGGTSLLLPIVSFFLFSFFFSLVFRQRRVDKKLREQIYINEGASVLSPPWA